MAANIGSFGQGFAETSRERFLPVQDYPPELDNRNRANRYCFRALSDGVVDLCHRLRENFRKLYMMGFSDPRKVLFAMKAGLTLALVSLVSFIYDPVEELSRHSVWATLTVVLVFEFSVGTSYMHSEKKE